MPAKRFNSNIHPISTNPAYDDGYLNNPIRDAFFNNALQSAQPLVRIKPDPKNSPPILTDYYNRPIVSQMVEYNQKYFKTPQNINQVLNSYNIVDERGKPVRVEQVRDKDGNINVWSIYNNPYTSKSDTTLLTGRVPLTQEQLNRFSPEKMPTVWNKDVSWDEEQVRKRLDNLDLYGYSRKGTLSNLYNGDIKWLKDGLGFMDKVLMSGTIDPNREMQNRIAELNLKDPRQRAEAIFLLKKLNNLNPGNPERAQQSIRSRIDANLIYTNRPQMYDTFEVNLDEDSPMAIRAGRALWKFRDPEVNRQYLEYARRRLAQERVQNGMNIQVTGNDPYQVMWNHTVGSNDKGTPFAVDQWDFAGDFVYLNSYPFIYKTAAQSTYNRNTNSYKNNNNRSRNRRK